MHATCITIPAFLQPPFISPNSYLTVTQRGGHVIQHGVVSNVEDFRIPPVTPSDRQNFPQALWLLVDSRAYKR
jgi:hypothetical protein